MKPMRASFKHILVLAVALGLVGSACGSRGRLASRASWSTRSPAPGAVGSPTDPSRSAATDQEPPALPGGMAQRFHGRSSVIGPAVRARMTSSWRPGCPVPVGDLRLLTLTHWGFDGAVHTGELVVHRDVGAEVLHVFHALFDGRFPIRRMEAVDVFGGDDDRSMAADNTSGFNCRAVTGHPGVWSEHSYGRAIDINPIQNPYVSSRGEVLPPAGARYADRSRPEPGMIRPTGLVVRAFARIGWAWGGNWASIKDYQHFSATGR